MGSKSFVTLGLTGFLAFVSGGWYFQSGNRESAYNRSRLFEDILSHVAEYYVDSISEAELYDMAIDGMLGQLNDPYTNFLRKDAYGSLSLSTTGDYAGIGIQIDSRDNWITVVTTFADTPGERVGLQPGDQIVQIDGESAEGWTTRQASSRMKGPAGTVVSIRVRRAGSTVALPFDITRAQVHVSSVEGAMILEDGIAYMRLTSVTDVAASELETELNQLILEGAKSLILDLRANPGGILTQGVLLADMFLGEGLPVVETRGRAPGTTRTYYSQNPALWPDLPLVVLINGFTASAAEIFSGAVQDHDRAILLGTPSFGKGVAYLVFPVSDTEALAVTSSRWYTPVGRSIDLPKAGPRHPVLAAIDSIQRHPQDTVFQSMGGRTLAGGGGIRPDILLPDTLLDGERAFALALDTLVSNYRNTITRYARETLAGGTIESASFTVTVAMRAELLRRIRETGADISDEIWIGAEDFVANQFGYELSRYMFGRTAELRRRALNDLQIARALELLQQSETAEELIGLASIQ